MKRLPPLELWLRQFRRKVARRVIGQTHMGWERIAAGGDDGPYARVSLSRAERLFILEAIDAQIGREGARR